MREDMEATLKKELRAAAISERQRLGITQEKMAENLFMSTRSYSDIECGITLCGSLTTVLLLIQMPDPNKFLRDLRFEFSKLPKRKESLV